MKKTFSFLIIAFLFHGLLFSQALVFEKSYDFSYDDAAHDVIATADSGFILCCETRNDNDIGNILLIKTDKNGEMIWSKIYGADSSCHGKRIIQTIDDNFLIAGSYGSQAYLLKINAEGDSIWSQTFPNEYGSSLHDIVELDNSDLLMIQRVFLIPYASKIIYADAIGNIYWTIPASANESKTIHLVSDYEFYVAGFNGLVNYSHCILTKYDILGNVVLNKVFTSFNGVNLCSAISQDENFYMAGMHENAKSYYANIIKSDLEGQLLWENSYFEIAWSSVTSILSVENNKIIACGVFNDELFILRINELGDSITSIKFNEYNMQQGNAMILLEDYLLIAGSHFNWGEGRDVYFLKLHLDTLSTGIVNPNVIQESALVIFPNPAKDKLHIEIPLGFRNQDAELVIMDMLGNIIMHSKYFRKWNIEMDISGIKPGLYYISAYSSDGLFISEKLIKN